MANDNMQEFIEQIIKEAGLDKMPQDFLEAYSEKVRTEAVKRLGIVAVKELNEKQIEEFNKLMEETGNDAAKMNEYLAENIGNFQEKMSQALAEFGREVIENAKNLVS